MSQFDGTLFDESLFGGGNLVVASGAAHGHGASSAGAEVSFSHAATLRCHGVAVGAPLRFTQGTGLLAGAGACSGAAMRMRQSGVAARGLARMAGSGLRVFWGSGCAPGGGKLAGTSRVSFAESGALRCASIASGLLVELTLPPPSRAGIRVAAWLRPGT